MSICGRVDAPGSGGYFVPVTTVRGTAGWSLFLPKRDFYEKELGERTIIPLVRLGLLELAADEPSRLLLSTRGEATWRRFLERGGRFPEDLSNI
ncbi:hypothetical protein [Methylosinus sp. KRF6]|uniref:hypothetical protein n=1 Tax=Methylosinus sp. KRF6 TaxID=2846853 RepID=UPI00209A809E|nr:hypothetical protein [Methylosinus sp. KRF6]